MPVFIVGGCLRGCFAVWRPSAHVRESSRSQAAPRVPPLGGEGLGGAAPTLAQLKWGDAGASSHFPHALRALQPEAPGPRASDGSVFEDLERAHKALERAVRAVLADSRERRKPTEAAVVAARLAAALPSPAEFGELAAAHGHDHAAVLALQEAIAAFAATVPATPAAHPTTELPAQGGAVVFRTPRDAEELQQASTAAASMPEPLGKVGGRQQAAPAAAALPEPPDAVHALMQRQDARPQQPRRLPPRGDFPPEGDVEPAAAPSMSAAARSPTGSAPLGMEVSPLARSASGRQGRLTPRQEIPKLATCKHAVDLEPHSPRPCTPSPRVPSPAPAPGCTGGTPMVTLPLAVEVQVRAETEGAKRARRAAREQNRVAEARGADLQALASRVSPASASTTPRDGHQALDGLALAGAAAALPASLRGMEARSTASQALACRVPPSSAPTTPRDIDILSVAVSAAALPASVRAMDARSAGSQALASRLPLTSASSTPRSMHEALDGLALAGSAAALPASVRAMEARSAASQARASRGPTSSASTTPRDMHQVVDGLAVVGAAAALPASARAMEARFAASQGLASRVQPASVSSTPRDLHRELDALAVAAPAAASPAFVQGPTSSTTTTSGVRAGSSAAGLSAATSRLPSLSAGPGALDAPDGPAATGDVAASRASARSTPRAPLPTSLAAFAALAASAEQVARSAPCSARVPMVTPRVPAASPREPLSLVREDAEMPWVPSTKNAMLLNSAAARAVGSRHKPVGPADLFPPTR